MRNAAAFSSQLSYLFKILRGEWNAYGDYGGSVPTARYKFDGTNDYIHELHDYHTTSVFIEIVSVTANEYRFLAAERTGGLEYPFYIRIESSTLIKVWFSEGPVVTYRKDISAILQIINSLLLDE